MSIRINQTQIFLWKTAVMKKSDKLFKWHSSSDVWLYEHLITHKQSTHHLENRDFKREVEWCDNSNGSIWPSVTSCKLSLMITWWSFGTCEISYVITTKVLEEIDCYFEFSVCLCITFGASSLDSLNKELPDIFVLHGFDYLSANLPEHQIPFLVLERIVKTRLGAWLKIFNEGLSLFKLSVWLGEHDFSCHRINDLFLLSCWFPLSLNKIVSLRCCTEVLRINCGECLQNIREVSLIWSHQLRILDCFL